MTDGITKELTGSLHAHSYLQAETKTGTVRIPNDGVSIKSVSVAPWNGAVWSDCSYVIASDRKSVTFTYKVTYDPDKRPNVHGPSFFYRINYYIEEPNKPPAPPAFINAPDRVSRTDKFNVNWGVSRDPEGDDVRYELQGKSGNGVYEHVYQGAATTHLATPSARAETMQFRVRAQDSKGASSAWVESKTIIVDANVGPVISGIDDHLGEKNKEFSYEYTVYDPDGDNVKVVETLNGKVIKTLTNAPQNQTITLNVPMSAIAETPVNQEITIEIRAEDPHDHVAYRRLIFKRSNQAPVITTNQDSYDEVEGSLSIPFSVEDPEGDKTSVTWSINGKAAGSIVADDGQYSGTITLEHTEFVKLKPKTPHIARIEAVDINGGKTVKNIYFTRVVNTLHVRGKFRSDKLDSVVSNLYISLLWEVANGAIPTVRVCNNADDVSPVWEDCTQAVLNRIPFVLANTNKTAETWAIGLEVIVRRGTSTGISWFKSAGGAIK